MVSLADSSSSSSTKIRCGRSMRTIRSTLFQSDPDLDFSSSTRPVSENLTDSVVDFRLSELAATLNNNSSNKSISHNSTTDLLDLSRSFSDFSSFNSDISGELQRLALCSPQHNFLQNQSPNFEDSEIVETVTIETVEPAVKYCVQVLEQVNCQVEAKRAAAARIRLFAKHRSDFRALIGASGAVQALVPLLKSTDPASQENAVTALLNLSLEESNKGVITAAGGIKPLIYALRTGTATAKQNAACALLNLSMIEDNRIVIGVLGAIPPLVGLLVNGSSRGKKDALTTLYKLCSVKQNKERAVSAGVVAPLVGLVGEHGSGTAEKAMVVLNSLAGVEVGREAIVEEGGIQVLVEAIEDGPARGKEFAVLTLLQLCADSGKNRGMLVREGAIPPLVALSQTGSARAKHKAETLLGYLREQRQDGASSCMVR